MEESTTLNPLPAQGGTKQFARAAGRLGLAFFVYMAVCNLAQIGFITLLNVVAPDFTSNNLGMWLVVDLPLYLVAFPAFLAVAHTLPASAPAPSLKNRRLSLGAGQLAKLLCIIFAVTYIGNYISLGINALLGLLKGGAVMNPLETVAGGSLPVALLFGALVPAVGEEYVFRGVVYKKLGGFGETAYILFSGFVFALFHGNISQLIYAFAIGCLLAWLVCRTGTLVYGMLLHFLVNCWGMGLAPLLVQTEIGALAAIAFILLASILGVVFLVRGWRKRQRPEPGQNLPAHPVRAVLLAPGMLLYEALCLALIVFVVLA